MRIALAKIETGKFANRDKTESLKALESVGAAHPVDDRFSARGLGQVFDKTGDGHHTIGQSGERFFGSSSRVCF